MRAGPTRPPPSWEIPRGRRRPKGYVGGRVSPRLAGWMAGSSGAWRHSESSRSTSRHPRGTSQHRRSRPARLRRRGFRPSATRRPIAAPASCRRTPASDRPELRFKDECGVGVGSSWRRLPERHWPPVVGDQDGDDVAAGRQVRRQVVAVVPQPVRLGASRAASNLVTIHPEHVSGVGGNPCRGIGRNRLDIESPPEHRAGELATRLNTSQEIRGSSSRCRGPVSNPVTGPRNHAVLGAAVATVFMRLPALKCFSL